MCVEEECSNECDSESVFMGREKEKKQRRKTW